MKRQLLFALVLVLTALPALAECPNVLFIITDDQERKEFNFLPTLVDFAGASIPPGVEVDGVSLKPFLTGKTDVHREYVLSCIGTTRLVRSKTHLLEVVNPILGVPYGRFYYCGESRDGKGYQRVDADPAHAAVRQRFAEILASHPGLTKDHPYFQTVKGDRWLKQYTDPKAAEKHLHNHRNYQFYDETLSNTQTSATEH